MTILSLTKNRRELVDAIGTLTGNKMRYQGPPNFMYTDGTFSIDREGNLIVEEYVLNLGVLKELAAQKLIDDSWDEDRSILSIDIPIGAHTAKSLTNLIQIIWNKEDLINKAVGATTGFQISHRFIERLLVEPQTSISEFLFLWESLGGEEATRGITFDDKKIHFIGFPYTEEPEWIRAYMDLATAICKEALITKKVKCEQAVSDNERYYFRVWLVRIGFTGDSFKSSRKVLLSNLEGNCAFRTKDQELVHREKYERRRADEAKQNTTRADEKEDSSLRLCQSIDG